MDKRELILDRLYTILKEIEGVISVTRNKGELPDKKRPAIVLLDADENSDDRMFGRSRPAHAPNIVILMPQMFLLLGGIPEEREINLGTELNTFRARVLKAILHDSALAAMVGSNGEIRYLGCLTDLATGRSLQGEMQLQLAFVYVLNPSEL